MPGVPGTMPIQVAVIGGGLLVVLAIVLSLAYFRSATDTDYCSQLPVIADPVSGDDR